jgi:hypothetical protein
MKFISGLFWQPLAGMTQQERNQEMKSLAREMDFDLYVVRTTSTHYAGFAHSRHDVRTGILSAAAVISKTLEMETSARDFIVVTQIPDGSWIYVAQRDGVVLPDGDKWFATDDDARIRLFEDISLGDWSLIIAPEEWGIPQSLQRTFEQLLPKDDRGKRLMHKWWRLAPINRQIRLSKGGVKPSIAGLVLLGIIAGGVYYYHSEKEKKWLEASRMMPVRTQAPPPVHPWKNKPLAPDMLRKCMAQFQTITLFPGNWEITNIKCANNILAVSWKAGKFGWIEHLRKIIPDAVITPERGTAFLSRPLEKLTIGLDEPVESDKARLYHMYAAAQRYGFNLTTSIIEPTPPPKPPLGSPPPQPNDWREIRWTVKSFAKPEDAIRALDGKGFRMDSMQATWDNGQLLWSLEGIQYVQP